MTLAAEVAVGCKLACRLPWRPSELFLWHCRWTFFYIFGHIRDFFRQRLEKWKQPTVRTLTAVCCMSSCAQMRLAPQ